MELILITAVATLVIPAVILWSVHQREARQQCWSAAAAELGLAYTQGGFFSQDRIQGGLSGHAVEIYTFTRSHGKSRSTYTAISVNTVLPAGLTLKPEGIGATLGKLLQGDDLRVGDPEFDQRTLVRGSQIETVAALGAANRRRVLHLLGLGGKVEDGRIYWEMQGSLSDFSRLISLVRAMVELANGLTLRTQNTELMLVENALKDPVDLVRAQNLAALIRLRPGTPTTLHTARRCLEDKHPEVALRAAVALGSEALHRIPPLLKSRQISNELKIEALKLLGTDGEDALLALLKAPELPTQRLAAHALASCGTLKSVEPLLPLTEGLLLDSELKEAARWAVESIQARCGGGERGAFSLSEGGDREGALSLAKEGGALSLAKAKEGEGG